MSDSELARLTRRVVPPRAANNDDDPGSEQHEHPTRDFHGPPCPLPRPAPLCPSRVTRTTTRFHNSQTLISVRPRNPREVSVRQQKGIDHNSNQMTQKVADKQSGSQETFNTRLHMPSRSARQVQALSWNIAVVLWPLWSIVRGVRYLFRSIWWIFQMHLDVTSRPIRSIFPHILGFILVSLLLNHLLLTLICSTSGVSHTLRWTNLPYTGSPTCQALPNFLRDPQATACPWRALNLAAAWVGYPCLATTKELVVPQALIFKNFHHAFENLEEPTVQLLPFVSNLLLNRAVIQDIGQRVRYTDLETAFNTSAEHAVLADIMLEGAECTRSLISGITVGLESTFRMVDFLERQHRRAEESWFWWTQVERLNLSKDFLEYLHALERRLGMLEAHASLCYQQIENIKNGVTLIQERQVRDIKIIQKRLEMRTFRPKVREKNEALLSMLAVSYHFCYQDGLRCISTVQVHISSIRDEIKRLRAASDSSEGLQIAQNLQSEDLKQIGQRLNRVLRSIRQAVKEDMEELKRRAKGVDSRSADTKNE